MTGLLADVLVLGLVVTATCSALLATVMAGQAAVARARRARPWRRRAVAAVLLPRVGRAAGPRGGPPGSGARR